MYLHKHFSANNVLIEKFPFQRELAMEAYLIENEGILALGTEGFNEVNIVKSEVTLLDGRKDRNTDGRIDILAKYGQEYIAVVELKKGQLNQLHLQQLESYLKERKQILSKFPEIWDTSVSAEPKWIGIMIGETIEPALMMDLRKGYYAEGEIPIAALTINRYRGEDRNVYVVTDTYFVEKVKNKDYTKYQFNQQVYGKSRLVLAVMKDYIQRNPSTTFSQLEKILPPSLQGKDTFTTESRARQIFQNTGYKRHFLEPDELIALSDATIAVSTQWGVKNIGNFIDHFQKKLGYVIQVIP